MVLGRYVRFRCLLYCRFTALQTLTTFHLSVPQGDADIAARALKRGLASLSEQQQRPRPQILVGVGYSMGAIILSNYVARSGKHCSLDAAISVSGGLDMRHQLNFRRSMRLWQPMLTFGLRDDILIGKHILYSLIAYMFVYYLFRRRLLTIAAT